MEYHSSQSASPVEYAEQFLRAMQSAGVIPAEDIVAHLIQHSGSVIRFSCVGEKRHKKNGFAVLYLDNKPAGAFGNWAIQVKGKWSTDGPVMFRPQRQIISLQRFAAQERTRERQHAVAQEAVSILKTAPQAQASQPYLLAKGLQGRGLYQKNGQLLAPMTDVFGTLWNLQFITANGSKYYLTGGRKLGAFWSLGLNLNGIGFPDPALIYLGEGVSTMLAVHLTTQQPVIAAMDAGSLPMCAEQIQLRFPKSKLVICADDDAATHQRIGKNPGLEAAMKAAAVSSGLLVLPKGIEA